MGDFSRMMGEAGDAYLYVFLVMLCAAMLMGSLANLRLVALFAGVAGVIHFALQTGFSSATMLLVLFTVIALVQILLQRARSKRGVMKPEELHLLEEVLQVHGRSTQQHLIDLLEWRDIEPGEVMAREGQVSPPLVYIASGEAEVTHEGRKVGMCGAKEFVGEMSIIAGEIASATVTAQTPMRIALIDRDTLLMLTEGVPEIGRAFDRAMNRGLAAKIKRMNDAGGDSEGLPEAG